MRLLGEPKAELSTLMTALLSKGWKLVIETDRIRVFDEDDIQVFVGSLAETTAYLHGFKDGYVVGVEVNVMRRAD